MVTRARPLLVSTLGPAVAMALLTGIVGGLVRAGVDFSIAPVGAWASRAALYHAALMMGCFLGTVIGIERAVAVKVPSAWLAPLASGLAGAALLLQFTSAAQWLLVTASVAFTGINMLVVRRQRAGHTMLLLAGALCWLIGNMLFALHWSVQAIVPWWFAFLVMTIAAERLEMTRLMRRRPGAQSALIIVLLALAAGAAASAVAPIGGGILYGSALLALAAWLTVFDIARRTIFAEGLPRYMAMCLLGGYAWLAVAGVAWAADALGLPARDIALHALGLGFVVSMMMAHAPVILPAIARVKLLFGRFFYIPLALLHGSLLVRLAGGWNNPVWREQGSLFNAVAIGVFAATAVGAAVAWRLRYAAQKSAHHGVSPGDSHERGRAEYQHPQVSEDGGRELAA